MIILDRIQLILWRTFEAATKECMESPAYSPDLNPIKTCWEFLDDAVQRVKGHLFTAKVLDIVILRSGTIFPSSYAETHRIHR